MSVIVNLLTYKEDCLAGIVYKSLWPNGIVPEVFMGKGVRGVLHFNAMVSLRCLSLNV